MNSPSSLKKAYARRESNEETHHRNHRYHLYRAVWAQSEIVVETLAPTPTAAVCAAETTSAESEAAEELMPPEDEIAVAPQAEEVQESQLMSEPEPESLDIPTAPKTQPVQEQASAPVFTQEPVPTQMTKELQPGDLVYVPGFGRVPYEGPNHCEEGTDIYENGNKIGIMG